MEQPELFIPPSMEQPELFMKFLTALGAPLNKMAPKRMGHENGRVLEP